MKGIRGSLLFFLLFLALWEGACRMWEIPPFLLPAPSRIGVLLAAEAPLLLRHSFVTLAEILLGIFFSVCAAIPLSLLLFLFPSFDAALSPLLVASQSIPVFALAPLLVVWFGYGMASKVIMASLIIFFPLTISLLEGFRSCDPDVKALFFLMGANFQSTFRFLYWPSALPYFFAGLKVAVSVAAIGAVLGEWVGSTEGLGFLMMQANARLRVDRVFAGLFLLSFLSVFLWWGVSLAERNVVFWMSKQYGNKRNSNSGRFMQ